LSLDFHKPSLRLDEAEVTSAFNPIQDKIVKTQCWVETIGGKHYGAKQLTTNCRSENDSLYMTLRR